MAEDEREYMEKISTNHKTKSKYRISKLLLIVSLHFSMTENVFKKYRTRRVVFFEFTLTIHIRILFIRLTLYIL